MKEEKTYSLGTVASMVGIPKYMLRQWCNRYLPDIHWIRIGQFQVQTIDRKCIGGSRYLGRPICSLVYNSHC